MHYEEDLRQFLKGLSGPVDKLLNSSLLWTNLYHKIGYTVYSIDILMWEVITDETPYNLAFAIVPGYRPKIYENIPLEYATLMKQCWDANPLM
ncbi:hypothetical protein Glove_103g222 [Diversispora epigaea]|uniref:Serine-threonine/tyrosine-protein kinase catalytic domain-containing protein n=1 Tax=Diversispora epigaea TaxID=1348612 RepID=A0A397JC83_9GLOM|nr:hypothetical protein Glove_103g222 [Diversispora epigaea]